MQLPINLLDSLEGCAGFDRHAFQQVHDAGGQITSIRLNPLKCTDPFSVFRDISVEKVPWSERGYYLSHRPSFTFDPLFHAGCYYVQEASSMFIEQVYKQSVDQAKDIRVLDLSAAPGGKTTHLQSLISPGSLLVSNDVIRSRANVLKDNVIKWGAGNVVVTNNDPRDFAKLESYFDVIVVDAPCSGSGLFRREPEAIEEWSLNNVALCSQRQQRILADVWPALKENGILIYSTCSYSKEEDEDIVKWMSDGLNAIPIDITVPEQWNIVNSEKGLRFWPHKLKGEGFFIAAFRKGEASEGGRKKTSDLPTINRAEAAIIDRWVKAGDFRFVKHDNTVYAWPVTLTEDMGYLLNHLRVIYSGVRIGEIMRDKLVPDHALAVSTLSHPSIIRSAVELEDAILYLQRKDMRASFQGKGWQLVTYLGYPLGWVNVLANRVNNYYPKELRIIKEKQ